MRLCTQGALAARQRDALNPREEAPPAPAAPAVLSLRALTCKTGKNSTRHAPSVTGEQGCTPTRAPHSAVQKPHGAWHTSMRPKTTRRSSSASNMHPDTRTPTHTNRRPKAAPCHMHLALTLAKGWGLGYGPHHPRFKTPSSCHPPAAAPPAAPPPPAQPPPPLPSPPPPPPPPPW